MVSTRRSCNDLAVLRIRKRRHAVVTGGVGRGHYLYEVKGSGFLSSLALHGLVLTLVVLSSEHQPQPQRTPIVAVTLVRVSAKSMSPPSPQTAPVPQDEASAVPQSEAAEVALAPIVAPQFQPLTPIQPSAPNSGATQKPQRESNSPRMVVKPVSSSTTTTARAHRLSPDEQLAASPELLAGRQTPATSHNARQQESSGTSNMTAANADMVLGLYAADAIRDFIRARPKNQCPQCFRPRHHSRTTTESSLARVEPWPRKWRPKRANENSSKATHSPWERLSVAGSKRAAATPLGGTHTAPDPATGQSSSSSSTASAGIDGSSSGSSSSSPGSTGTSSSASSSSSAAPHGVPSSGLAGLASGAVGHALGALAGAVGGHGGHGGK
jgi:hypothetical protein